MTASQLMASSLSGVSDDCSGVGVTDLSVSSAVGITISSIDDFRSTVIGAGANYEEVVTTHGQLSESTVPVIDTRTALNTSDDDFTAGEWEEVKQQVLVKLCANTLDTPEAHLSYVREQLARANARYV